MSYKKGVAAEEVAKAYLIDKGLKWVQSHYRSRFGEIDLVMQENSCLVFVEVKYRRSNVFGLAYETVSWRKQRKLVLTALQYIGQYDRRNKLLSRFDVVGLQGCPVQIDWIQNAFEVNS